MKFEDEKMNKATKKQKTWAFIPSSKETYQLNIFNFLKNKDN
jgi:hypothetical protein